MTQRTIVGQSKRWSMIESWANIVIGFAINYSANLVILPIFGLHISLLNNFYMGLMFTVISVVRSYYLRRAFNWFHMKMEAT